MSALPAEHELRKLCLFGHAGRQCSRRSGAMSHFFALLGAQSRSFCKLTGDATVNSFSSEKKTKSTACSESSVVIETWYRVWLKRHNFGVHVSPGSAEILVRRDVIKWAFYSIYSLSNSSAKIYQNRLMCVEVRACNISIVFETQCIKRSVGFLSANTDRTGSIVTSLKLSDTDS